MAVPNYTTDLTELATGDLNVDAGTWDESSDGGWDDAGSMVDDQNLYYNNTECVSAQFTKDGIGTIIYGHGTGITIPTDGAILMWHMWAAPPALATKANGGVRILVGDGFGDFEAWIVSGNDFPPEFIWNNHAINPNIGSPDYTVGTSTVYSYFGTAVNALQQARGNPNAMNAIRYGRCTQIYTGGETADYAIFSGYAAVDNIVTAKYALLRYIPGGYLFQGLMSLGITATAVDFRDSNVNITIADTENVTTGFNAIEVHHASSNVEWTAISISALGTNSKGTFEMIANATVLFTSCTFTDMNTWVFQSNADLISTIFRRCGQTTQGSAVFTDCVFDKSSAAVALVVDDLSLVTGCTFNSDGSNHAINLGNIAANDSISWDNFVNDYAATDGSTGNETILVDVDNAITLTINVADGADTPTYYNTGTGTVDVVAGSISLTITGLVSNTEVTIVKRGATIDTGSDGATTASSRNFVTGNSWSVDAYKGHLLEITSGNDAGRYYVSGNSTTTLYLDAVLTTTASTLIWELYDENDDTEAYHIENSSGDVVYTYTTGSGDLVDILMFHVNYQDQVIENYTLPSTNTPIPIAQIEDINYYNLTDITAPLYVSSEVGNVDATSLILTYDSSLDTGSVPATTDFSVNDGAANVVTNVSISNNKVDLTLTNAIENGDTVIVSYTKGSNPIQDSSENEAVNLSSESVTNNVSGAVELVTNGDFSDGLNGWNNDGTYPYDTFEIVSGELHLVTDGGEVTSRVRSDTDIAVEDGKTYRFKYDYDVSSGQIEYISIRNSVTYLAEMIITGSGSFDDTFVATATENLFIYIFNDQEADGNFTLDNFSLIEE